MTRRLPNRRPAETFELEVSGLRYTCTIGRFDDGELAEVFINNPGTNSAADVNARDGGILVSLLLQHGCGIATIAHAVSRSPDGAAAGVVGVAPDKIMVPEDVS